MFTEPVLLMNTKHYTSMKQMNIKQNFISCRPPGVWQQLV